LPHSLQSLDVSYCYNITDEGIKSLPMTLTCLNVAYCYQITDEGMSGLPPLLTHLNVESCNKVTNEGLKTLPQSIQHLNLQGCVEINDEGITFILSHLQNIDFLNIGNTSISSCLPFALAHAQRNNNSLFPNSSSSSSPSPTGLRYLDLTQCNISDESIRSLETLSSLEYLNLFKCVSVTNDSLKYLPPNLEFVNFKSTSVHFNLLEQQINSLGRPNLKFSI